MSRFTKFEELKGKILKEIIIKKRNEDEENEEIKFITNDNEEYILFHDQSCCEDVYIEDICGDINDLIGEPIFLAEQSTNKDNPKSVEDEYFTWTFYRIATSKGHVDIRWYGRSNGYYSEEVDFIKEEKNHANN